MENETDEPEKPFATIQGILWALAIVAPFYAGVYVALHFEGVL